MSPSNSTVTPVTPGPTYDRISGDRPAHVHACPQNHTWKCNSPYCEVLTDLCPTHGGDEPVKAGREPWRGR
jgi:hypothetical protein